MIKIAFTGNWGITTPEMKKLFDAQTPNNSGIWNDIQSVDSIDEANYVIVQDDAKYDKPPKGKVIFFGREPEHVNARLWADCYASYHHAEPLKNSWLPATWWINMPYNDLVALDPPKTKNLSVIDSGKNGSNNRGLNHTQRFNLIMKLAQEHPMELDIYGGISKDKSGPFKHTLGSRDSRDKKGGLINYRYNLALENGTTDLYFSEKFIDPILCMTTPIYWGCKNIDKFFPKGSYYQIDPNSPTVAEEIVELVNSDYREQNIEALREAKDLVLNKYNIWATIERAIKDGKVL
jgi:hypothetical protein